MKIGIAVTTTPNRADIIEKWYDAYRVSIPGVYVYFHNDTEYKGVVYSKNQCLADLVSNGCDYMFLFDDDCLIKDKYFITQYINSQLNHACWNYNRRELKFTVLPLLENLYSEPTIIEFCEYEKPNGCMLFVTKYVVSQVGGFDTDFKGYGYEHVNWSDRIYNNGLTPARYIDIPNSKGLFEMADCESSFSYADRMHIPANYELYQQKYYSKEFKPFK